MTNSEKSIIITGANTGLGYFCAKHIATENRSWHVVLACRDPEKAKQALEEIENTIFHNYLHLDIDLYRIKYGMIKLLNKSGLNSSIKERIIKGISKHKIHSRGLLKKKIDINLSGYLIKINSFVS